MASDYYQDPVEDAGFIQMEAEQAKEYEAAGDTDTLGDVVNVDALADDSENAGLDDTRDVSTSTI